MQTTDVDGREANRKDVIAACYAIEAMEQAIAYAQASNVANGEEFCRILRDKLRHRRHALEARLKGSGAADD